MANKSNAVLNPAGIFVDGPRLYTTKTLEARNIPATYGNVHYVDKSISASGNGKSWSRAKKTITEAVAAASDYDVILIAPGFYTEAATLTVTQTGLKMYGVNTTGKTRGPVGLKTPTSAGPIITVAIDSNDVEIANLAFITTSGQKGIQLGGAATGYVWRTHIHDCSFHGDGTGTYGIAVYGATTTPSGGSFPDVAECTIENNWFYAWATACICAYGTRVAVKNNTCFVPASGYGIVIGVGRPFGDYTGNRIFGVNSSDTGFVVTGSDEDALNLDDNTVKNVATPITVGLYTSWYDGNNFGSRDYLYHTIQSDAEKGDSGDVWYVDAAVSASGDGRCWKSAFKTITEAVAAATTEGSVIRVARGDYDEGAAVAITVRGTKIIGCGDDNRNVSMIYSTTGTYNLMEIDGHEVEIIGMGFSVIPDTKSAIVISGTSASYKCRIAHCRLDGWSGEYGVYLNESPDTLIEHNLFRSFNTAAVYANSTRTVVRNNIFHVVAAKIGIEHIPAGGSRPDNVYIDNVFSGATSSTTTAIKFTGAPSDGTIICARNRLCGTFDVDITAIAAHGGVDNYAGDADGGVLIDTCSG